MDPTAEQRRLLGAFLRTRREKLTPADVRPGVQPARGRTESTGTFATSGVPPGKYLVSVQGGFPNWTFQSAMVNGRDASIYPVDVESNESAKGAIGVPRPRLSS